MLPNKKYDAILFTGIDYMIPFKTAGAYHISAQLRKHGYSVKVIDNFTWLLKNRKDELFKYMDDHIGSNTLFVGFSTTFMTLFKVEGGIFRKHIKFKTLYNKKNRHLQKKSKAQSVENLQEFLGLIYLKYPRVQIIVGGSGPTTNIFTEIYKDEIDCWIKGLAEDSIIKYVESLKNNEKIPRIIEDPFASNFNFHELEPSFYPEDTVFQYEVLPIEVSRGCRFKCKFCSYPLLGRKPSDDYIRSEESLYKEFLHNYENFGTTQYQITCDTFNETTEKLERVKKAIDRSGIKINFWAYLRIELLHTYPEQISLLKEMGISSTFFGLETLNDESGKCIGKGLGRDKQIETLQKLKDAWGPDVLLHGSFIIGLPYETKETAKEWTDILIRRETALDSISINPLYLVPDKVIRSGKTSRVFFSEFDLNYKKYGYTKTDVSWTNDYWTQAEALIFAKNVMQDFEATGKDPLANNYRASMHPVALMNSRIIDPKISWKDIITPQKSLKETNKWVHNQRKVKHDIYEKYAENVFTQ